MNARQLRQAQEMKEKEKVKKMKEKRRKEKEKKRRKAVARAAVKARMVISSDTSDSESSEGDISDDSGSDTDSESSSGSEESDDNSSEVLSPRRNRSRLPARAPARDGGNIQGRALPKRRPRKIAPPPAGDAGDIDPFDAGSGAAGPSAANESSLDLMSPLPGGNSDEDEAMIVDGTESNNMLGEDPSPEIQDAMEFVDPLGDNATAQLPPRDTPLQSPSVSHTPASTTGTQPAQLWEPSTYQTQRPVPERSMLSVRVATAPQLRRGGNIDEIRSLSHLLHGSTRSRPIDRTNYARREA